MLPPLAEREADVVYGSRFQVVGQWRALNFWQALVPYPIAQGR